MPDKRSEILVDIAKDDNLMEIARKAIEDTLVWMRDDRISVIRNNGLVIKERDGSDSHVIRIGSETAMRIGLEAIAKHLSK